MTIADFVADLRAPTPSAAAELAISDIRDIMAQVEYYHMSMTNKVSSKINQYRNELKYLNTRLSHVNPIYPNTSKETISVRFRTKTRPDNEHNYEK